MNPISHLTPLLEVVNSENQQVRPPKNRGRDANLKPGPRALVGVNAKEWRAPSQRSAAPSLPIWAQHIQQFALPPDLLTRQISVDFAVDGLIQAGKVGALVAAGGTGKTTLLLILGICIALGRMFLGCAVKQGSFVLLSLDDSQADLEGALKLVMQAMNLNADEATIVLAKVRVVSLQEIEGSPTFATTIGGHPQPTGMEFHLAQALSTIPDLVGISLDTLRHFAGGSSNDEQIIKLTVSGATRLALSTGAFVILPHHTGKQNFREGITDMYAGSGSAAIADNCRFVLLLQTTTWSDIQKQVQRTGLEQGDPLVLRATRGSLLVKPMQPIFLCRDGHLIKRIAGQPLTKDQQLESRDRKILDAVLTGAQSKNDICKAVGGKKQTLIRAVDSLIAGGMLVYETVTSINSHSGGEQLRVSDKGIKFLSA